MGEQHEPKKCNEPNAAGGSCRIRWRCRPCLFRLALHSASLAARRMLPSASCGSIRLAWKLTSVLPHRDLVSGFSVGTILALFVGGTHGRKTGTRIRPPGVFLAGSGGFSKVF